MPRLLLWPVLVVAALMPVRRWTAFYRVLPVRQAAPLAGLVTMLLGLAVAIHTQEGASQRCVIRPARAVDVCAPLTIGCAEGPRGVRRFRYHLG